MPLFTVKKPVKVPLGTKNILEKKQIQDFVKKKETYFSGRGCYVFVVNGKRVGDREKYLPIYVGKATKSFRQECFNSRNIQALSEYLVKHQSKSLYLYLIDHPAQQ